MYHILAHPNSALPSDDAHWASSDSAFPRCSPTPPLPNCRRRHYHTPIQKRVTMWHRCASPLRHNLGCTRLRPLIFCVPPCRLRQACQPGSWGAYSPSPTSRVPLAVGSAANRLVHPRTSEMAASPGRPTTEWLGLRTAKAFAAAGLLGHDVNNSASRFGIVRSLGDRDQHALAPSQLSLSEVGSVASSWHSGSMSRATTHSQATSHD